MRRGSRQCPVKSVRRRWALNVRRFAGAGRRCEPLTVRDEFSRYGLELRAMDNARTQSVREAFERVFERYGLPEAIRSDNGTPLPACWHCTG